MFVTDLRDEAAVDEWEDDEQIKQSSTAPSLSSLIKHKHHTNKQRFYIFIFLISQWIFAQNKTEL